MRADQALTSPGCNQCGDGFNAPADCDRSPASAIACRARIRRLIAAHLQASRLRADRNRAIAELVDLATDAERRERLELLREAKVDDAAIAGLRREVFAVMRRGGVASIPAAGAQAALL